MTRTIRKVRTVNHQTTRAHKARKVRQVSSELWQEAWNWHTEELSADRYEVQ